ncbi:LPD7 domain-containing protein [Methylocystis sp.]|uniref:LPD7 domain-containing protein n=1 Tax=Methylocystis sp. TaxID=1911079 RepID=UPI003D143B8A
MSDAADTQGDFAIERVAEAGDDRKNDEPRAARDSEKRDPILEAVNDAPPPEKSAPTAAHDYGFPDRVRRKYYVVADQRAKEGAALEARVYADERGEYLAFKATEDRLTTRLASAQVVHDMIAVAGHRNWQAIHLRGSAEFRREAWLEASARGMEVKGYEPTDIDRQALASRREARERANRRPQELWNRSNLSKAKPGDRFERRRNGADRAPNNVTAIDASPGKGSADRRPVAQGRWRARADKFRAADRKAAARDADLVAAQSQLAIIEKALERAFPRDPQAREKILDAARERIAQHLEQGRSFERAIVKERVPEHNGSRTDRGEARRNPEEVRERTRQRER